MQRSGYMTSWVPASNVAPFSGVAYGLTGQPLENLPGLPPENKSILWQLCRPGSHCISRFTVRIKSGDRCNRRDPSATPNRKEASFITLR
jgi:hypothetical protein